MARQDSSHSIRYDWMTKKPLALTDFIGMSHDSLPTLRGAAARAALAAANVGLDESLIGAAADDMRVGDDGPQVGARRRRDHDDPSSHPRPPPSMRPQENKQQDQAESAAAAAAASPKRPPMSSGKIASWLKADVDYATSEYWALNAQENEADLTPKQKVIFDIAVSRPRRSLVVQAPKGRGKTHLALRLYYHFVEMSGRPQSVLYINAKTAQSAAIRFAVTLEELLEMRTPIAQELKNQSEAALLTIIRARPRVVAQLQEVDLVIWDNGEYISQDIFRFVDVLLRKIRPAGTIAPFGNVQMLIFLDDRSCGTMPSKSFCDSSADGWDRFLHFAGGDPKERIKLISDPNLRYCQMPVGSKAVVIPKYVVRERLIGSLRSPAGVEELCSAFWPPPPAGAAAAAAPPPPPPADDVSGGAEFILRNMRASSDGLTPPRSAPARMGASVGIFWAEYPRYVKDARPDHQKWPPIFVCSSVIDAYHLSLRMHHELTLQTPGSKDKEKRFIAGTTTGGDPDEYARLLHMHFSLRAPWGESTITVTQGTPVVFVLSPCEVVNDRETPCREYRHGDYGVYEGYDVAGKFALVRLVRWSIEEAKWTEVLTKVWQYEWKYHVPHAGTPAGEEATNDNGSWIRVRTMPFIRAYALPYSFFCNIRAPTVVMDCTKPKPPPAILDAPIPVQKRAGVVEAGFLPGQIYDIANTITPETHLWIVGPKEVVRASLAPLKGHDRISCDLR